MRVSKIRLALIMLVLLSTSIVAVQSVVETRLKCSAEPTETPEPPAAKRQPPSDEYHPPPSSSHHHHHHRHHTPPSSHDDPPSQRTWSPPTEPNPPTEPEPSSPSLPTPPDANVCSDSLTHIGECVRIIVSSAFGGGGGASSYCCQIFKTIQDCYGQAYTSGYYGIERICFNQ